jgi:nicotinamidase-related amidase
MALAILKSCAPAVLIMDYQQFLMESYTPDYSGATAAVGRLLESTRVAGVPVLYITVGFRRNYPEVSDRNAMFTGVRAGRRFQLGDASSAVPECIAPRADEAVVVKHRVSAFEGTDLAMLLRAKHIDTLVVFGITTSGVVLSTVRQAADLDFRIIVLEDLCFDGDHEVHRFLVDKILPRQATVMTSREFGTHLSGSV